MRLFNAACARRVAAVMPDDGARRLADLAEQRADGLLPDREWLRAVVETITTAADLARTHAGVGWWTWCSARSSEANPLKDTIVGHGRVRSRPAYAAAVLVVIGLGLWSRSDAAGLPWAVAKYAGDALWGLVVFLGIAFLLSRKTTGAVAWLATVFACAVEVSQLYHAPWLDAVRATRPGGLVLGTPPSTFAGADIAAYAVGIAVGIAADRCLIRKSDRVT